MSAENCGGVLSPEMIEEATKVAVQSRPPLPVLISVKADKMLQRIKQKFPDWEPQCEAEVWIKAYKLGLMDDDVG